MSKEKSNDINKDKLRQQFDESVNALDAHTVSKITQARYRALESRSKKSSRWLFIPAGVAVTACLFLMVFMLVPGNVDEAGLQDVDVDLISSSEELDLYEELEFYEWLEDYELPS